MTVARRSFQTDSVKSGGSDLRMYPVCGEAATGELQSLMYHPVARALVFGRQGQLYKVCPRVAQSSRQWLRVAESG